MLEEIKKIQGINHNEFDSIINDYLISAELDLKAVGISITKIKKNDCLIKTAKISYVLSLLDIPNSAMWSKSYALQKDALRRNIYYMENNGL